MRCVPRAYESTTPDASPESTAYEPSDPDYPPEPPSWIEWKDTIPFIPPITEGQVIKVYDGDTITVASRLPYDGSPLYRFSVRLNGIDSPEMKGKSDDEKQAAKRAQQALSNFILHKTVALTNNKTEKYGRILSNVYCDGIHINQWMIENRYAVEYDGGTKNCPESWLKYQNADY